MKLRSNCKHLKATNLIKNSRSPMLQINVDGCLTDPEPDVDSRRATVRNMRSMCRCSCVLQFTFRRAVSCDLHRPPSQVIHCIMLFYLRFSKNEFRDFKKTTVINPYKGRAKLNFGKAEVFQQLGIPSETKVSDQGGTAPY